MSAYFPPAFDDPIKWVPIGILPCCLVRKTRMVWLPDGEKILKKCLFVLTEFTNVTDTWTHTHRHRMMAKAALA